MNHLNSVILEGMVTAQPILASTPTGIPLATFSITTVQGNANGTKDFSTIEIETWEELAGACATYLTKGRHIRVHGEIKQDRWSDSHGYPQSRLKIVAKYVEFLSRSVTLQDVTEMEAVSDIQNAS